MSGVLRVMRERSRDALLEQGIPLLYATFGQLHWEIETGDTVASPLLLLRVRLDRTPSFTDYTLTAAEAEPRLELNPALRYLLQRTWNLSLDDLHAPYHLDTVMEELRHRISGQPHWYVTPDAFLGLFPLEKFVLLEDIQQHEQTIANHPVIRALAGAAALPVPPATAAPSSEEWQVVDADASQRDAIAAAARGQSLIIQGPPGTGKSQTITNIIAQKLSAGQTVLFVSEKLAVHGDNIDEHAVAAALLEASGAGMPAAPAADPGPDLAAMKAHAEERASIQRAIDGYFAALTDRTNAWGRSAYEVIGEIANLQDAPKTQFDFDTAALGGVTSATVKQMHDALDSLAGVADICAAPREHRWHEIDRHQALDDQATRFHLAERLTAFRDRTRTLGDQQDRLRRTWGLAPGASVADARWLWRLLADVSGRGDALIPSAWFTTGRFTAARSAASEQVRGLSPVRGIRPDLLQRYGPAIFDVTGLDTFDAVRAVRSVLTPDPALTGFSHAAADRACARFAELDALCLKDNAARLVAKLSATRVGALAAGNLQAEIMALGQAAGGRVTRPLRQLFGQIPNLLSVLKPCLLMSPAAVARYLGDWTVTFDTVIFDEASQIMTADVIGSIARADKAVVVGDSRQLPPTRFFTADGASDEEPESLLDACSQVRLPNEWLLWHYRSQHEDLIAFSNHAFYGGRLVTFPSPRQDLDPIEFVPANGVFDRGGSRMNRIEAAKVVDLVIDYARQSPDDTIGIITFSEPQMTAIQHELDDRRADPEVARLLDAHDAHGLFVRNLERVQGDERDAIFFSVGYGPDAEGNFRKEFGPLNRPGGDRRLNVAITRAKKKITIVASFDPHELANYPRDGVRLLGEYLLFAAQTPETRPSFTEPPARERRSFPDAVARGVSRDHSIRRDVGVGQYRIDIGVIARDDPRRCVLGIDCDGSVYAAAPDIRDRERLRPAVLTGLGWTLHRVWSLPWLNERTHELERIKELVGEREDAPRTGQPPEDASNDSFPITLPGDDSPAPLEPETPVATAPDGTPPAEPPEKATKRPTGGASKRRKPAAGDTSPATPGAIKGLDAAARVALATAGITTVEQLLAAAATDAGRRALATNVGAPPAELRHWVTLADLNRIPGIGAEFAGLLDAAGIASCRELRQRNPENLREALEHLNAERKLTKQVPALARLTAWIAAADALAKNAGPS